MRIRALFYFLAMIGLPTAAGAAECPGNPDALGTSRVLVVDPTEHPRLGTMQYHETLPLNDHEVVLTFDDGPLPPYTTRVLETLKSQCVKATYFIIGRMARAYPEMVREIHAAGHTVGTHTQNHPYTFNRMPVAKAHQEMDEGIASVTDALGDSAQLAPFFRIPGLIRADVVENYMASRGIMIWSADFPADDWRHISAAEVMHRALTRLEAHGKGILLLHDIQPATVMMLPALLRELKHRGYRIVHVVPASATSPKTATTPQQWVMNGGGEKYETEDWPRFTVDVDPATALPVLPAPSPVSFGLAHPLGPKFTLARPSMRARIHLIRGQIPLPPLSLWPRELGPPSGVIDSGLPAPSPKSFGYGEPLPQPAADTRPAGPLVPVTPTIPPAPVTRADTTGSVGSDGHWPLTTANMPKSGIP
jgi:peptidoglycan/xylan/chitin deacetylase (PgdA/CDA1 family)